MLNVAKMIESKDILRGSQFGFENSLDDIYEYPIDTNSDIGNLWKPSMHFTKGLCYTFNSIAITANQTGDIIANNKTMMSTSKFKGNMLQLKLYFEVTSGTSL